MRHDVFISYCRRDGEFARLVERSVKQAGFTTWRDLDLNVGDDWRAEIDNGIKGATAVIAILSPPSGNSMYVTYEWSFALGLGVPVLPIRYNVGLGELHPRLNALQTLDFSDGQPPPWEELCEKLRALGEARRPHTIHVPRDAPPVVQAAAAALDSMNDADRRAAVESLSEMKDPAAIALLGEALWHPVGQVRYDAAVVLGRHHDARAVAPILEAAELGQEVDVGVLARIGPTAVPALREALRSKNAKVRETAMAALGGVGDPTAIDALGECLGSTDPEVRQNAARILEATQHPAAVPVLRAAMNDPAPTVRRSVASALANCGGASVTADLVLLLHDSDPETRDVAAWRLGLTPVPEAAPALLEALHDEYDQAALHAAEALEKIGDPATVPALIQAAAVHPNDNARSFMKRALQGFGAPAAPALRLALEDPDERVRAIGVEYLRLINDPADIPRLQARLRDESSRVRFRAVTAFKGAMARVALRELIQCAKDEDPAVRDRAVDVLGHSGDPAAAPSLIEALRDDNPDVARRAADSLGELRDPGAVPALLECLRDDGVEKSAAWALEKIGTREARIALRAWKQQARREVAGA